MLIKESVSHHKMIEGIVFGTPPHREKSGSKTLLIFSKSLMTLDFCAIVEPLAPKYFAITEDDVLSRELLLNMKLMLQMVYTDAAAHISTLPDCRGQERLRPSFCTSFVQSSAHSSSKCSLQKATASSITFASLSFSCCLSISSYIKIIAFPNPRALLYGLRRIGYYCCNSSSVISNRLKFRCKYTQK